MCRSVVPFIIFSMKSINDNFVNIQGWMVAELKITGNDLILFALIYGFCQDGKSKFSGSLTYVEQWLGCSRPTAIASLNRLIDRGYIEKHEAINKAFTNSYTINFEVVKNLKLGSKETLPLGSKETLPLVVKKLYQGSKETLPNTYSNNSIDKIGDKPATLGNETLPPSPLTTANNLDAYKTAKETLITAAAARSLDLPEAKFADAYFLNQQQRGHWYALTVPTDPGELQMWLAKHIAGLKAWARREPSFRQGRAAGAKGGEGDSVTVKLPKI